MKEIKLISLSIVIPLLTLLFTGCNNEDQLRMEGPKNYVPDYSISLSEAKTDLESILDDIDNLQSRGYLHKRVIKNFYTKHIKEIRSRSGYFV